MATNPSTIHCLEKIKKIQELIRTVMLALSNSCGEKMLLYFVIYS
jgi:hypothetical protein